MPSYAEQPSIAVEVLSASVGGAFSSSALYPLELLKTKVQAAEASSSTDEEKDDGDDDNDSSSTGNGTIALAKRIYDKGGISAFYAGVETSAIQSATEKALYFFAYTGLKNAYALTTASNRIGTLPNLALGCAAEWAHLPITLPIDCLTTKIQTDKSGKGAFTLLCAMLSEKGLGGMYKGVQAYTILCFKPAIQYTVYEQIKRIMLVARQKKNQRYRGGAGDTLSSAEAFLLGMVSRTIATVLVFPYIRAKVMMQSGSDEKKKSIGSMMGEILKEGGMKGLFQGLGPELTRGVLSAALMMMMKERIGWAVGKVIDGR
eukprot:CAMPEP_0172497008 /NCGR_PEP_ID=MMETSP1066-20121228/94746_1 /TAXON_ID=671091 /ORGANISM="Coscinodiscus wailesii, Strain CCMP2513" /LENGTH=316 /DNA_ID=CAMNT_0013269581 /DNA_START=72 /DNA_END=1022 /DNA_ORIENTATION=-